MWIVVIQDDRIHAVHREIVDRARRRRYDGGKPGAHAFGEGEAEDVAPRWKEHDARSPVHRLHFLGRPGAEERDTWVVRGARGERGEELAAPDHRQTTREARA